MKIPVIRGVIDRRILVNFQVDPDALSAVLPDPLRSKLVGGVGIGGVCLIRLKGIRPRFVPTVLGIASENAAHRIAVVLPEGGEGVFIPRRDTSSRLNTLVGGRLFPGQHHYSEFEVEEQNDRYSVILRGEGSEPILAVKARAGGALPSSSVFKSLEEASAFFEAGSLGYSATQDPHVLDGLELRTKNWHVEALDVEEVYSSYFEDRSVFPDGTVRFDCGLLMRQIDHEWHAREPLYCGESRRAV
ncbi:MAG: DUF2071 domain-containing protein [Thermoanaerobaculia bacterium]|nr:DUF2071 domain-containing protein [Thermoanaerobaculia bacterium]